MNWLRTVVSVYGVINILGGVIGFMMAGSLLSLIVGGIAGLLLIVLAMLTRTNPAMAWRTLGVVVLALAGFWIFRITEVQAQGKSIMMPLGNLVLSAVVFACLGAGHMLGQKKHTA